MLIVGLGNPGSQYKKTRHNIGRNILESFAKNFIFPSFKENKRKAFSATEKEIFNKKVILGLSLIYMNESGRAIKNLLSFFKLGIKDLWIIHDDLDLPLGKIRISKNRSAGGHKGVQSIIDHLGIKNFVRFRVGIGRKFALAPNVEVLKKFAKTEKIDEITKLIEKALIFAIENGIDKTMQKFN